MKVTVKYCTEFGGSESTMDITEIASFSEKFKIISVTQCKKDKFKSFDGTNQTFAENDETPLEDWQLLQYRMNEEGFDYCFNGYSNWEEIKDMEFHKLKEKYLKAMEELKTYIDKKSNKE